MPDGLLPAYRAAYNRPHKPVVRVDVWDDREQLYEDLPIFGGSVDCTLTSQVTRRGSITLDPQYTPRAETDLLAPFGNRLRIWRGIDVGGRRFMFRVFTGMIMRTERKPRQPLTVTFADRAAEVDENDFEAAEEMPAGRAVGESVRQLIREGVPGAEFGDFDVLGQPTSAQVFEDSRAQAADELADTAGAFWYALADGRFVLRRIPWAYQPDGVDVEPVVAYDEYAASGDTATGSITDYGEVMSRENVYNVVVGVADQPDGADPRRETVRDTVASSPTYVGGKFGKRVLRAELPSAATSAIVRHGADFIRRRSRASAEALPWEMIPDPSLELGDVVRLNIGGRALLRAVSEFTMPLSVDGSMSCSGRPIVMPNGDVISEVRGWF